MNVDALNMGLFKHFKTLCSVAVGKLLLTDGLVMMLTCESVCMYVLYSTKPWRMKTLADSPIQKFW